MQLPSPLFSSTATRKKSGWNASSRPFIYSALQVFGIEVTQVSRLDNSPERVR